MLGVRLDRRRRRAPTQVTVTIYERSDVGPDVACIAMAQQKSATVTLGADLGGRTVVDGGR